MLSQVIIKAINRVIEALEEKGIIYAIFGGLALQAWKRLRSTLDIDIMVISSRKDLDSLTEALLKKGLRLDKSGVNLEEIALLEFIYPDEESLLDIKVDIAVASGNFAEQVVRNRIKLNVFGKDMRFVKCEDLILLKMLSPRPIDIVDAKELFHLNKEVIDLKYLRKQALKLKLDKQLRDIETHSTM